MLGIFRNDLTNFCNLCLSRNIQVVLATQANRHGENNRFCDIFYEQGYLDYTYDDYVRLYKSSNEIVREVAYELKLPLIDLEKNAMLKISNGCFYDNLHFSNAGALLASQVIADEMYRAGVV